MRNNNRKQIHKLALLSILTSLALILSYVEAILPPIFSAVPGIKLGFPNIVIIFILYRMGIVEAAAVSFVRIVLVSLLFGSPLTFIYSATGAALSLVVMMILKKLDILSTVGVSIAGGVAHNLGQILVAMLLLGTAEIGYYMIVLAVTGTLADPKMKLDVGAIAKGYAVEMVAQSLEEKGISGYVINVGGNVRTVGAKGNGEKWTVGIENPEDDGDTPYLEYLYLAGESVVTSGSYQRYYIVDGKEYHHIIDSETLMPAEGYRSVSIVCKNSGVGDALSTALFCMGFEEGLALVESLDDVEAMWIFSDGTEKTSDGFLVYTEKS